jgi:hypothetical protein
MKKIKKPELKSQQTGDDLTIDEPTALAGPRTDFAVSIVPKIKNNKACYEIVKFYFTEDGFCGDREVVCSVINENTALIMLFQTANDVFNIKDLRKKIKNLKGK